ncbi:tellurite resistance TerB family protein [Chitinophaga flava]|uniref:Uncharacterized protein n=1 Tax=Chitinophaga flava TaxID=2259036 RepID=A0A365Y5Q8_9BACT|nr:TerB family tellurite resistance protein [Chitinophaga flava]RBL93658.1 hypothetical protein DF182_14230 [Chitinophaga flava]
MAVGINISNYESYLLSYVDNELNESEKAALMQFLEQHPQLRAELELLENICVAPDEQLVFDNKAALYRTSSAETTDYESLMLSLVDGELSAEETAGLKSWLQHQPQAQQELALLQLVKLEPDHRIVFENKASLYRSTSKGRIIPAYWWGAASTAAVVAGLLIWLLPAGNRHTSQSVTSPMAHNTIAPVMHEAPVASPVPHESPAVAAAARTAGAGEAARLNIRKKEIVPAKKNTSSTPDVSTAANNTVAVAPAPAEAPVISALPSPRNTSDEVVEKHLQNTGIAASSPADNNHPRETVMAANIPAASKTVAASPVAATPAPSPIKGELILSVSGSDSRILDKVTNVAKFFSRKRNK